MKINWKVRIKNEMFWIAIIPAVLMTVVAVGDLFGIDLEVATLGDKLIAVVKAVFGVLAILGVVVDPTTAGVGDSARAMMYTEPYSKED